MNLKDLVDLSKVEALWYSFIPGLEKGVDDAIDVSTLNDGERAVLKWLVDSVSDHLDRA